MGNFEALAVPWVGSSLESHTAGDSRRSAVTGSVPFGPQLTCDARPRTRSHLSIASDTQIIRIMSFDLGLWPLRFGIWAGRVVCILQQVNYKIVPERP